MSEFAGELRELMGGQLAIWHAQQLAPNSPAYNVSEYLEIQGALDVDFMVAALRRALDEAETYRLRFRLEDGVPRQYVTDSRDYPIQVVDVSTESDPDTAALEWMRTELRRPVDLGGDGPLFVFAVLKLASDRFHWYQRVHHLVLDGLGASVLAGRVAEFYNALVEGREAGGGALESVTTLIDADLAYRASADFRVDRDFWLDALADLPDSAGRGVSATRRQSELPRRHTADIGSGGAKALKAAARRLKTSFAGLMVAAAAVYQYRVTGEPDLVLGVPVRGRFGTELRSIPGMTSNLLPVRVSIRQDSTVEDLVRQVKAGIRAGLPHQRYRSEDMLRDLKLVDGRPLCEVIVNVMAFDYSMRFGGHPAITRNLSIGPVGDLEISICDREADTGIQIDVDTNSDLHGPAAGASISQIFLRVLEWLESASPSDAVGLVDLLDDVERRRVLVEWNETAGVVV
ncbi:condensation domain-containing protein, partial [Kitasatospora nipponensis]|uniref:condensation domain-containing protein n=1 Tax=Kitasatospora nipponensis TaxID=258049 RepID=UPI0031DB04B4